MDLAKWNRNLNAHTLTFFYVNEAEKETGCGTRARFSPMPRTKSRRVNSFDAARVLMSTDATGGRFI